MTIKTELCSILDIEVPIIQGGMAWVATGELAAAVSKTGGLGIIGAGNAPVNVVREEIKKVKKETRRSFAVNIMLLSPFVEEIVDLVIEENVPVITTGAGNPGKYINRFRAAGIKVLPVVSSVTLGKRMERLGVDGIIAEGTEAGGHVGKLTTMTLTPQIVDQVNIPVIAAGGIADGRGLIAALSLGAKGIQMGTRFVCCTECIANENYKNAILEAQDRDTIITGRSAGHPVRNIKNKLTRQLKRMEENKVSREEIESLGIGKLREAVREGNIENGSVMAGQISGLIKNIKPAAEIINDILTEANKILSVNRNLAGGKDND